MTHIIADRFMMKTHLRAKGGQTHDLTHQGVIIGDVLEPIGDLFMKLIKMIIVPLVFASLLVGVASLGDMRDVLGDRRIAVCRELTKVYEEVFRGNISEAIARFATDTGQSSSRQRFTPWVTGRQIRRPRRFRN